MELTAQTQEEASCGFLDGDYLEQFFSLSDPDVIDKVMSGRNKAEKLKMTKDQLFKVLEAMRGLR